MKTITLDLHNFLAIKEASLISNNNLVVLLAPNCCGKTHILRLLYSLYWTFWKVSKDSVDLKKTFLGKLKKVFLIKDIRELISWDENIMHIQIKSEVGNCMLKNLDNDVNLDLMVSNQFRIEKSPLYVFVPGLGDFYRGVFSIKKYYPSWNIVSEAITDFITDLVIVGDIKEQEIKKSHRDLLKKIEDSFKAKFSIQSGKINIYEQNRSYSIEKTASGLKTIAWLYLIIKYGLIGDLVLIDEPENSLHPEFIQKLSEILFEMSQFAKIIIATHSDYLLESLNFVIKKMEWKVDVWYGQFENKDVIFKCYEANKDKLIDSTPLTKTFLDIVKKTYGREN